MIELKQTFTEEQKKENLRLAIKALRENPKKAKEMMQDGNGGRCCLCVMAHVAEDIMGYKRNELCNEALPLFTMSDVFAVQESKTFPENVEVGGDLASRWNDGGDDIEEKTHAEIADMLEKEYHTD
jgi:hypothetical protein